MSLPRYAAYKPSGVEWLGEVPEHWEAKRLKYNSSINDEALPETTDPGFELEYVDIGSVDSIQGITTKEALLFEDAPSRARRIVRDGDTIVSTVRTYLKAVAPIEKPEENLIVSTGFAVVRPRKLFPAFLAYCLRSSYFIETVVSRSTGVSYPAINPSEISRIEIPVPTIEEQQTIARFLDAQTAKLDTLVAKKRELIDKLKEKRSALIARTVTRGLPPDAAQAAGLEPHPAMKDSGVEWLREVPAHWDENRLGFLCKKIGSGKTPLGGAETYVDEGIVFIRSQNVYDDGLALEDVVYISEEVDADMRVSRIKSGDILLNVTGASIGRSCIVPDDFPAGNVNQHVCIIRLRNLAQSHFVSWVMKAPFIKSQIDAIQSGAAREGLNFDQISKFAFALPSHTEQQAIAAYLDRETAYIDQLIAKVEAALSRLTEYRQALVTAAVTGKIDVRDNALQGEAG